jgi:hypothetical protein
MSEKAAVKPDFATAAKTEDGPPFTKVIRENTKPQVVQALLTKNKEMALEVLSCRIQ